jgi:NAD(P)-dependent dehydrogenase (short-subunit alcohol dehydrogenase family)
LNVGQDPVEPPAMAGQVGGHPTGERGSLRRRWVEQRRGQLGPDVRAGEIDRGVLPDLPGGARQAPDVEAVEADQLARVVDRDMARLERHEIATVAAFLASDAASYITGATISVNGGSLTA